MPRRGGAAAAEAAAAPAGERRLSSRAGAIAANVARVEAAALDADVGARLSSRAAKLPAVAKQGKKAAVKRRPAPEEAADESEEDEEESDAEQHPAKPPPTKKSKTAEQRLYCLACQTDFPARQLVRGFFCPVCDMVHTQLVDSVANVQRAQKQGMGSPVPGAAASVQTSQLDSSSSSSGSKPRLSPYESELKRLLEASGAAFPRFQEPDPLGHEALVQGVRKNTYIGSAFTPQSEWLTKLIRSGRFKELSLALRVSNAEEQRRQQAEAQGIKVLMQQDGQLISTSKAHAQRPLASLEEFYEILIFSVFPSLADRPRAWGDWVELACSVADIEKKEGWPVASGYLNDMLMDRIHSSLPFNTFDQAILNAARVTVQSASAP